MPRWGVTSASSRSCSGRLRVVLNPRLGVRASPDASAPDPDHSSNRTWCTPSGYNSTFSLHVQPRTRDMVVPHAYSHRQHQRHQLPCLALRSTACSQTRQEASTPSTRGHRLVLAARPHLLWPLQPLRGHLWPLQPQRHVVPPSMLRCACQAPAACWKHLPGLSNHTVNLFGRERKLKQPCGGDELRLRRRAFCSVWVLGFRGVLLVSLCCFRP